jgi:predicted secreted protein
MSWFTGLVVYFLIWWVVLFAVLPIGTRPNAEPDPDSGFRGIPQRPRLWRKVLVTTLVAAVVWGGVDWLISSPYLSFRHGYFAAPKDE